MAMAMTHRQTGFVAESGATRGHMQRRRPLYRRPRRVLIYGSGLLLALFAAFPFLWMLSSALKTTQELSLPVHMLTLLPQAPTLRSFVEVWTAGSFQRYFLNSLIVSGLTTSIALALAVPAGYAFARYRLPGGRAVLLSILFTQMFPAVLMALPFYFMMRELGLINTLWSLIITYITIVLPFSVWTLRNYFLNVPPELEECARVDGCTRVGALWRAILPVAKPGIAATAIYCTILTWNEFMYANTFVTRSDLRTLALGLQSLIGEYTTDWPVLMAGSVVTTLPVILLFALLQRHLIQGLAAGSLKG